MFNCENDVLINLLVYCVMGYKQFKSRSMRYLMGQTIRQYVPDESHCHYTTGFEELWGELSDSEFFGSYNETIKYTKENDITVRCYKGASHSYREETLTTGESFRWNDVFHYEHTTTVKSIMEKLIALDEVNYDTVKAVLETVHITRMTKEENISLHNGSKRDKDFESVVENLYNTNGVYLVK